MNDDSVKTVTALCLQYLARREHSQHELRQKLLAKGISEALIEPVLMRLQQEDWQSDARFAESFTRQRISKGYGPARIAYELRQRGVANVADLLKDDNIDWDALLEQAYCRKYSASSVLSRKEWAKRSRFLQQRGFDSDMIKRLFRRLPIDLA